MSLFFLVLMILCIFISVGSLAAMIYGFATVGKVIKSDIEYEEARVSEGNMSANAKYTKEKGVRYSYRTEYQIVDFAEKLKAKNPKAVKDAYIVFGITGFIFFTFFAMSTGMIAFGNWMGWIFLVIVGGISVYLVYYVLNELKKGD